MSTEAIEASESLREYARELHNRNAAVFVGAGFSTASGYVDWKGLLREVFQDLRLDAKKEHDLVTIAQYYCNQAWRATGVTVYLENGGRLEHAQQMAAHESPRTTKLYDRTKDEITIGEVERIQL